MRAAFRFEKLGAARWISHLDLMRAMSRAVRRAGLPAKYSQGFHPHVVMSFAQALGVGCFSGGEYMEISLGDAIALDEAVNTLNDVLPNGIRMTGAWRMPEGIPSLMASVSAALWLVEFEGPADDTVMSKFTSLPGRENITVEKEGKGGKSLVDIRPGLYSVEKAQNGIELSLAAGSKLNIRPELVVKAALGNAGAAKAITRLELYSIVNGRREPLYKLFDTGDF